MKKVEFEGFTCFAFDVNVSRSPLSDSIGHLLLESSSFPDYYARNNFPPNKNHFTDRHLYLLVKEQLICFQDHVLRSAYLLRQKQNLTIKAFPGQIKYHNQVYQSIRINLKDIEELPLLIEELESLGIDIVKDKKAADDNSHVVYKKYTEYEKLDDGIFRDHHNENRYFFSVPRLLDYNQFSEAMDQIKRSCNYNLFDSFLSYLFVREKMMEFIGIYSNHCDQSRFKDLKMEISRRF
ncbi:MAG: hypothetical protein ABFS38_08010 [Bacteroidota bacterium]